MNDTTEELRQTLMKVSCQLEGLSDNQRNTQGV
jgi:hypothetical protein